MPAMVSTIHMGCVGLTLVTRYSANSGLRRSLDGVPAPEIYSNFERKSHITLRPLKCDVEYLLAPFDDLEMVSKAALRSSSTRIPSTVLCKARVRQAVMEVEHAWSPYNTGDHYIVARRPKPFI